MNRLIASLYLAQFSPIATFRLVYKGSISMRCAVLIVLVAFCAGAGATLLTLESDIEERFAVATESKRLSAAGSMLGIATAGGPSGRRLAVLWAPAPH